MALIARRRPLSCPGPGLSHPGFLALRSQHCPCPRGASLPVLCHVTTDLLPSVLRVCAQISPVRVPPRPLGPKDRSGPPTRFPSRADICCRHVLCSCLVLSLSRGRGCQVHGCVSRTCGSACSGQVFRRRSWKERLPHSELVFPLSSSWVRACLCAGFYRASVGLSC